MSERVKTLTIMRDDGITRAVNATTPGDEPNAHIRPIYMMTSVGVRTARVFVQSFLAFLTVQVAPDALQPDALERVMPQELGGAIWLAGQLSLFPAFFTFGQNLLELLTRLDQRLPLFRACLLLPLLAGTAYAQTPPDVCHDGCAFKSIQKAIDAAADGATVTVGPGVYEQCFIVPRSKKDLTIVGQGAHLQREQCEGRGAMVIRGSGTTTIIGFECSNMHFGGSNIACVRAELGGVHHLVIRGVHFHDSTLGVLGDTTAMQSPNPTSSITIERSRFERNGIDGPSHNIYLSKGMGKGVVRDNDIALVSGGHAVKCGADECIVENNRVPMLDGRGSMLVHMQLGGKGLIKDNVLEKGPRARNPHIFGFADEPFNMQPADFAKTHMLRVESNIIINDSPPPDDPSRWRTFLLGVCPLDLDENPNCAKVKAQIELVNNTIIGPLTAVMNPDSHGATVTETGTVRHQNRAAAGLAPYPFILGMKQVESVKVAVDAAKQVAVVSYSPATQADVYTALQDKAWGCGGGLTTNCGWTRVPVAACGEITIPLPTKPFLVRVDNGGPSPVVRVVP